jgi:hypothetical protein
VSLWARRQETRSNVGKPPVLRKVCLACCKTIFIVSPNSDYFLSFIVPCPTEAVGSSSRGCLSLYWNLIEYPVESACVTGLRCQKPMGGDLFSEVRSLGEEAKLQPARTVPKSAFLPLEQVEQVPFNFVPACAFRYYRLRETADGQVCDTDWAIEFRKLFSAATQLPLFWFSSHRGNQRNNAR